MWLKYIKFSNKSIYFLWRSKYLFRDILDFHRYVHPEKPIRDASIIASKLLLDFDIESYAKQEIFNR